jgi:glucose-1-phosphate adenylyltransferase
MSMKTLNPDPPPPPPFSRHAMAYVLAGGRGSRLLELTDWRAKPAVYFGGTSRIIDFVLSNALNSGIRRIAVATQYKAHSLIRHLQRGWNFFRPERNESFDILPASQRVSETMWYVGTADAVYQNIDIIESYAPRYMVVLAGDHIYKMDFEKMLVQHVESKADVTVGCLEAPLEKAREFGVMRVVENDRIVSFLEKPANPPPIPDKPGFALCSMGIYVFETKFLIDELKRDAADRNSSHDFGKDLIPYLVANGKAVAHSFSRSCVVSREEKQHYWRDVGTVDAYWAANLDLTDIVPASTSTTAPGRSGPTPRSRRRRSSSMTSTAGAASRSRRWSPAAASSPAARCRARCCRLACACIPTRRCTRRSSYPTCRSAATPGW